MKTMLEPVVPGVKVHKQMKTKRKGESGRLWRLVVGSRAGEVLVAMLSRDAILRRMRRWRSIFTNNYSTYYTIVSSLRVWTRSNECGCCPEFGAAATSANQPFEYNQGTLSCC